MRVEFHVNCGYHHVMPDSMWFFTPHLLLYMALLYHTKLTLITVLNFLPQPPSLSVPHTFSSPSSSPLVAGRVFQTGKGYSTGSFFYVHPTISNYNVLCTTLQPVMKDITVLGGHKVIEVDQDSPEAEIAFALTQIPSTVQLKIWCVCNIISIVMNSLDQNWGNIGSFDGTLAGRVENITNGHSLAIKYTTTISTQ